ncbi:MAG TPA: ATP-binding protein [Mycobacteriales bacterium]|nr:ATP-binding protein [Mycobacteriales bacterium]
MSGSARLRAGQQGGRLLLAAGAFTLVNNYLPGSEHLDIAVLNAVALTTLALGVVSLRLPWDRLSPRAPLALVLVAFALIAVSNLFGGVSSFSYAVYFVVVFVWVGLAQPPGTSLALAPLAVVAYLLPFLVGDDRPPNAIASVTVAVPVCLLVGETLARYVRRLERSHAEVVAQREHEQAVVDVLADGVLVLDRDGHVTSCNECATAMLGTGRDELLGSAPPLAVPAAGAPVVSQVGGRWLEAVATELLETGERVVTLRDVSRQRALDEAKDLFLATTSHELRTPLTAVKGYVHVLQRRWDRLDDAARLRALATIAERTEALVTLTDHLLLGARAGASRHSGSSEPFDLGRAVASTARTFESVSDRHRVVVAVPQQPVVAVGDPASVQHIVGQLVENAIKYSPGGGAVTVTVRTAGAHALVEVADVGVGIPAGSEASLFTPFFQAAAANTREYGGVGLGLYIVRQLVEAQGGTVEAQNRPGGGALFRVGLPQLAVPATSPEREPAERREGPPTRLTG